MDSKKRVSWSVMEIETLLRHVINDHELYMIKKRLRKTAEFWSGMGLKCCKPGDATEKLMKNLGFEFQKVRQLAHISGCGTDLSPQLRGSEELYLLYEEYYSMYFPVGGSVCPKVILTENSMTVMDTTTPSSVASAASPVQGASTSSPVQAASQGASTASTVSAAAPASKVKRLKRHRKHEFLDSSLKLHRQELSLKRQELSLRRQGIAIERKRNEVLDVIFIELQMMRSAYCLVNDIKVDNTGNEC